MDRQRIARPNIKVGVEEGPGRADIPQQGYIASFSQSRAGDHYCNGKMYAQRTTLNGPVTARNLR
jgi:hypothetical protein